MEEKMNKDMIEIEDEIVSSVSGGSKSDLSEFKGIIIETCPNATYLVELIDGRQVTAYVSGKLRVNYIKINIGDSVVVEISNYSTSRAVINKILKK